MELSCIAEKLEWRDEIYHAATASDKPRATERRAGGAIKPAAYVGVTREALIRTKLSIVWFFVFFFQMANCFRAQ